jgi:hypothetical protein
MCLDFTAGGSSARSGPLALFRFKCPIRYVVIDQSRLQQRVRLMRIFRRRNSGGLLDDTRPDKSNLSTRFSNQDVAERREACRDAAERRIGENRNEREFLAIVYGSCRRHFRHLHQREHALLHSRAATGRHADKRNATLRRLLERMGDFFTHHRAHRPAQKAKIENDQDRLIATDATKARSHGFADSCFPPSLLEAHPVGFVVCKAEGIDGHQVAV